MQGGGIFTSLSFIICYVVFCLLLQILQLVGVAFHFDMRFHILHASTHTDDLYEVVGVVYERSTTHTLNHISLWSVVGEWNSRACVHSRGMRGSKTQGDAQEGDH
jgi:hypothetical protein